jgi:hypothetical protein
MEFNNYKLDRVNNINIDWDVYLKLNKDISEHGIDTMYKLLKHWFEHGINEHRLYNNNNTKCIEKWGEIKNYLKNNQYKHTNVAFIITASVRNKTHLHYLTNCIRHIRVIYPNIHIYIINDNSVLNINNLANGNIDIIPSLSSGAGELNPYLFVLDPRCKHDKLVYIHDTVFIKRNIDYFINRTSEIDFLWCANTNIDNDIFKPENLNILNSMFLYFSNSKISVHNFINIVKLVKIRYNVKFGCMSVFTKRFMEKVDLVTNFRDVSKLFNCRMNRCFFERLLSFLHIFIYGYDYNSNNNLCGDIFRHPSSFTNTNINILCKTPLVKVWQGR